jgi:hypothetical protein
MTCESWLKALLPHFSRANENVRCNTDHRQDNDEENKNVQHTPARIGTYAEGPKLVEKGHD